MGYCKVMSIRLYRISYLSLVFVVVFSLSYLVYLVKYLVLVFARAFHRSCLKVSAVKRIKGLLPTLLKVIRFRCNKLGIPQH